MEMHGEEPALDQIRLLRLPQADGAIRLAHRQVELLIGKDELHLDLWIEVEKFRNAVGQPSRP